MNGNQKSRWKPLTERAADPAPLPFDGVDFSLSPRERDQAKDAAEFLEKRRCRLNERDGKRGDRER